jgi:hypothetical protein
MVKIAGGLRPSKSTPMESSSDSNISGCAAKGRSVVVNKSKGEKAFWRSE